MAQVVVTSDADQTVLMRETVLPAHINDEHSALQFLERLAWAIEDAEERRIAGGTVRRRGDAARRDAHRRLARR